MNELKKEEVFSTLNRITEVINQSPLIRDLSNLLDIKTTVVGGAIRDLYLDKPIKDIDIAISLDFNHNLKVQYSQRKSYRYNNDMDDYNDYWDRATSEAEALKVRNFDILKHLEKPEYAIVHEFMEQNKKDLSAIDVVAVLIRKIIEKNEDYLITQVFDKTTLEMLVEKPKLTDIPYQNMGLCAVVALKDKKNDYPIELLFTTDNPNSFIRCFDFNICKIYMENKYGNPVIITSEEFLKDCENKTITYTPVEDINENKINKSLMVRYPRFYEKFPDFNLVADIKTTNEDMKLLIERTISAITLAHELKNNDRMQSVKTIKKSNKL